VALALASKTSGLGLGLGLDHVVLEHIPGPATAERQKWNSIYFYRAMQGLVQSAVLRSHQARLSVRLSVCPSVRPSVTLVDQDHIGWKSWKL